MQRPRNQFLACAALAGDQHSRPTDRSLRDELEYLQHPRTSAHDGRERLESAGSLGPKVPVLLAKAPLLDGVGEDGEHLLVLERLGDVVEGTTLHGSHRRVHRRVGGNHQHRQAVIVVSERVEYLQPIHVRHHHVDNDRIERTTPRQCKAVRTSGSRVDGIPGSLQQRLQHVTHHLFIVDDENGAARCSGRR